ncbi:MAG: recombination mediator RecR [Alphaproteobacteria bacterium]|nr:recombination mediator RecR [Alphaproteobacteria bacterium]
MELINQLVTELQNLPGLGQRSARRIALYLLAKQPAQLVTIAELLKHAHDSITNCAICGNLGEQSPCAICQDSKRAKNMIAIVENVSDLWAIERSHCYHGCYHVLGGVLSAIEGVGPEQLRLNDLQKRVQSLIKEQHKIELILATNLTVEGQTTAHYISKLFSDMNDNSEGGSISITHLAHGLPAGGELDYLDDSTIITAIRARS